MTKIAQHAQDKDTQPLYDGLLPRALLGLGVLRAALGPALGSASKELLAHAAELGPHQRLIFFVEWKYDELLT